MIFLDEFVCLHSICEEMVLPCLVFLFVRGDTLLEIVEKWIVGYWLQSRFLELSSQLLDDFFKLGHADLTTGHEINELLQFGSAILHSLLEFGSILLHLLVKQAWHWRWRPRPGLLKVPTHGAHPR